MEDDSRTTKFSVPPLFFGLFNDTVFQLHYYEFLSEMTLHENHENIQHDLYLARDSNAVPHLKCILRGEYGHLFLWLR